LPDVFALFDDYAARFARGERPEAGEYLNRAGPDADELARLIEGFVARTPAPTAGEDTTILMRAWIGGEAPLVALRAERGLKRDQVVDTLVERLGLDSSKRDKVKRRYHALENGLLDSSRVDRSVWEVLAETLKARASDLMAWRPRPLAAERTYLRVDEAAVRSAPSFAARVDADRVTAEEPDEVDRLFGVG
jgi:hypothetical protein